MWAQSIRILRAIRIWLENFSLSCIERVSRSARSSRDQPRRLLLFRNCFVGDFVVCFPALAALRREHPGAKITFLNCGSTQKEGQASSVNTDAYALASEWVDEFITIQYRYGAVRAWIRAVKEGVRRVRPDAAAVLLFSDERYMAKLKKLLFLRLTGVDCRIVGLDNARSTSWLTVKAIRQCGHSPLNHVEAAWQSVKPLLSRNALLTKEYPVSRTRELPTKSRPSLPYLAVFPGTKMPTFNCWPAENYAELCRRLLVAHPALNILLIGGPQDRELCNSIVAAVASERACSVAGENNLMQTAALLSHAGGYIGNDSGPMHIAASVGCPIVAVFSSYQPESYWAPWSTTSQIIRKSLGCDYCRITHGYCHVGDYKCVKSITVADVLERALTLL